MILNLEKMRWSLRQVWPFQRYYVLREARIAEQSIYIYIYAFSGRFYPKRLTVQSGYTFFCQYMCSLGIYIYFF